MADSLILTQQGERLRSLVERRTTATKGNRLELIDTQSEHRNPKEQKHKESKNHKSMTLGPILLGLNIALSFMANVEFIFYVHYGWGIAVTTYTGPVC